MRLIPRTLGTAFLAIRRNMFRSALTTLGIVIGIAAVIAIMEIGQGSAAAMKQTIASMGANMLLVLPGTASSGGVSFGSGSAMTLTPQDADAIHARECPAVPTCRRRGPRCTQVVYGNKNWVPMYIYGSTPEFLEIRDWTDMAEGSRVHRSQTSAMARPSRVGQTVVRQPVRRRIADRQGRADAKRRASAWSACSATKGPTCSAWTRTISFWPRGRRSSFASAARC